MTIQTTPVRRTQGFTLIEMLVVAALIAIFAGLAVFNIVEQLQREKEKAALAEARSIATAMSFAYDDLGFFPKLCFLKYGVEEMKKLIVDESLANDSIDYFGFPNPSMGTRISSSWGEKYMGGSMPEKYIEATYSTSAGDEVFDWPADPFRQPYVAYFVKIEQPDGGGVPEIKWLENAGDRPNYFAGIVSYGRNKVPGLTWDADQTAINTRTDDRLYIPLPGGTDRQFRFPGSNDLAFFNQNRLNLLIEKAADLGEPADYYTIREAGSDDKFFEF